MGLTNQPSRLPVFLFLSLLSCATSAKREAATLVDAVDRYRRADDAAKEAQGRAVARVECSDSQVCDAKRACLAAIDPTTRALALKDEVARGVSALEQKRLDASSPEARDLPAKLDEAERLLKEGRDKMPDCEQKTIDLRVKYGV